VSGPSQGQDHKPDSHSDDADPQRAPEDHDQQLRRKVVRPHVQPQPDDSGQGGACRHDPERHARVVRGNGGGTEAGGGGSVGGADVKASKSSSHVRQNRKAPSRGVPQRGQKENAMWSPPGFRENSPRGPRRQSGRLGGEPGSAAPRGARRSPRRSPNGKMGGAPDSVPNADPCSFVVRCEARGARTSPARRCGGIRGPFLSIHGP
jgi:hypothetical protein